MVFCKKCGKENKDFSKFCTGCGNDMSTSTQIPQQNNLSSKEMADNQVLCTQCGNQNKESAKFCIKCGSSLALSGKPVAMPVSSVNNENEIYTKLPVVEPDVPIIDNSTTGEVAATISAQQNKTDVNDVGIINTTVAENISIETTNNQVIEPIIEEMPVEQILPGMKDEQNETTGNEHEIDLIANTPKLIEEEHLEYPQKKSKKTVFWLICILVVVGLGIFFIFGNPFNTNINANKLSVKDTSDQGSTIPIKVNDSFIKSNIIRDTNAKNMNEPIKQDSTTKKEADSVLNATNNTVNKNIDSTKMHLNVQSAQMGKPTTTFYHLNKYQIKTDLQGLELCEEITFRLDQDMTMTILKGLRDEESQTKLDLYTEMKVTVFVVDKTKNKSCTVELVYQKDRNKFTLTNHAEK